LKKNEGRKLDGHPKHDRFWLSMGFEIEREKKSRQLQCKSRNGAILLTRGKIKRRPYTRGRLSEKHDAPGPVGTSRKNGPIPTGQENSKSAWVVGPRSEW